MFRYVPRHKAGLPGQLASFTDPAAAGAALAQPIGASTAVNARLHIILYRCADFQIQTLTT